MIGLDVHISQITDLSSRTVVTCHSATEVDIRASEPVASSSLLFEEIIYNEREMKSVMLVYFKYVP